MPTGQLATIWDAPDKGDWRGLHDHFTRPLTPEYRRLLASPALARADFSSVRLALSGAAPCPWDLAQQWRQRTGVRILRGYGLKTGKGGES